MTIAAITGTYVLHEHTFSCQDGKWPISVEVLLALVLYNRRQLMAGKKNTDATQNLPPEHPTQVGPGGTKLGLPTRVEVFSALAKVARKKPR
jgi:hypothetical protein